jgi:SP family general alpha glucoside:H+ symporter-like MFS transporter
MASRNNSIAAHVTETEHHDNVLRVKDSEIRRMSINVSDIAALTMEAKQATQSEKNMTVGQAWKLYKKAVMFSILFSTAIVMEGYDIALINAFFAFPPFANKYGVLKNEKDGYQIPAKWQVWISQVPPIR